MKSNIIGEYVEFIYCGCRCGFTCSKYYLDNGRPRKDKGIRNFINGHQNRGIYHPKFGKHHSEETRRKMSIAQTRELNHQWKGDSVGMDALHTRIRKIFPKTKLCQICNQIPPRELSNKSGKYLHNKSDWQWLCSLCHKEYDGIIEKNLKPNFFKKKS